MWVTPLDNSNPQLFASGQTGSLVAPWITAAGSRFHFKTTGGVLLATAVAKGNLPPDITLTAPGSGGTYLAPASFAVSATASDPDGSVQRVEFWGDGQQLAIQYGAPYGMTWSNIGAGNHSIQAIVYDNLGNSRWSGAATFTVRTPQPNAQFISQSVLVSMLMGATQTVSVQMKNTGDLTWTSAASYSLGSQNPGDNGVIGTRSRVVGAGVRDCNIDYPRYTTRCGHRTLVASAVATSTAKLTAGRTNEGNLFGDDAAGERHV